MISYLVLSFSLGIILARFVVIPFVLVYIIEVIIFVLCIKSLKSNTRFIVFLSVFVFLLGSLYLKNAYLLPQTHLSRYIYYKSDTIYNVWGYILDEPEYDDNGVSFLLSTYKISFNKNKYNCSGEILVRAKEIPDLVYGEAAILCGEIHRPTKFFRRNISGVMHIRAPSACVRLVENRGFIVKRFALYLRGEIGKLMHKHLSVLAADILEAMIIGEKKGIPAVIYDSMIKSGTVHILVVSGFNVGVVAFIIMLFLKILRIPRMIRYILAIFSLIIYCFATGASAPVVRATLMAVFFLVGFLIKRDPNIHNSLSLAALIILLSDPKELFSVSFQLSFSSVLAIILIYPKVKTIFKLESIKLKFIKFIAEGCAVSLSAWLGTCVFILCYFKIFSPVTVLANIVIVPLATLITLSGFSLLLVNLILPVFTPYFATTSEFLVAFLLYVNLLFIRIPFAYFYL